MEPAFTTFCSRYVLLTLTIFTVATQARPGANNFATQQESGKTLLTDIAPCESIIKHTQTLIMIYVFELHVPVKFAGELK